MKQPLDLQEKARQKADRWRWRIIAIGAVIALLPWPGLFVGVIVEGYHEPLAQLFLPQLAISAWWFSPFLLYAYHAHLLIREGSQTPRETVMRVRGGAIGLVLPYVLWYASFLSLIVYMELALPEASNQDAFTVGLLMFFAAVLNPILCILTVPLGYGVGALAANSLSAQKRPAS